MKMSSSKTGFTFPSVQILGNKSSQYLLPLNNSRWVIGRKYVIPNYFRHLMILCHSQQSTVLQTFGFGFKRKNMCLIAYFKGSACFNFQLVIDVIDSYTSMIWLCQFKCNSRVISYLLSYLINLPNLTHHNLAIKRINSTFYNFSTFLEMVNFFLNEMRYLSDFVEPHIIHFNLNYKEEKDRNSQDEQSF